MMVISERKVCGRYCYFKTYAYLNVILFFRYDTFIKSRGGDFGHNSTGQGKATLAWTFQPGLDARGMVYIATNPNASSKRVN